jgi:hypothetical protein
MNTVHPASANQCIQHLQIRIPASRIVQHSNKMYMYPLKWMAHAQCPTSLPINSSRSVEQTRGMDLLQISFVAELNKLYLFLYIIELARQVMMIRVGMVKSP